MEELAHEQSERPENAGRMRQMDGEYVLLAGLYGMECLPKTQHDVERVCRQGASLIIDCRGARTV